MTLNVNLSNGDIMNRFTIFSEFLTQRKQPEVQEQEVKSPEPKVKCILSQLEGAVLTTALEMASLQLYIIDVGNCSSSPLHSNGIVRKKIREVIERVKDEISETNTFFSLAEKVQEEIDRGKRRSNLRSEFLQNRRKIEDLKLKLKGHELAKSSEMNKKQEIIAGLKDKIHEEVLRSNIKLKYIDKWEAARQNQNRLRFQNAIIELEQKLEELAIRSKNEIRAHDEMCNFLILEEKRLQKELCDWNEKYQQEMKKKDEKMKYLRTKRKEQQILIRDMNQLYEERKQEIDDYLDFKEIIQQEEEKKRLINNMATKIQAWWRGTMVRRGLGPFKRKKKPAKEKKNKNK